ncbi:MAG: ECF transporter S component, partial [Acidimicrobiales bacterium]|nr:ECF transporter S component [Acidimicrobiales bacterium]
MIRIRPRAALTLTLASAAGLAMFLWPLLLQPATSTAAHRTDSPMLFVLLLPALVAVIVAELSDGGIDSKALAMLGVLAALGAALRPLGAGTAGIETVFFLLILAGRVYGAGFGFVLGAVTLFASALLTGGVGPWLPFQMLASGWVGLGAGFLPRAKGKLELALLAVYGAFAAYAFGFLLNLWFWPFAIGPEGPLSYVPGGSVATNLTHFFRYCLATSTWGWDTVRAVTNVVAICAAGPVLLGAMRRAARKAAFDAPVTFSA